MIIVEDKHKTSICENMKAYRLLMRSIWGQSFLLREIAHGAPPQGRLENMFSYTGIFQTDPQKQCRPGRCLSIRMKYIGLAYCLK